jgi:hypothetical protein
LTEWEAIAELAKFGFELFRVGGIPALCSGAVLFMVIRNKRDPHDNGERAAAKALVKEAVAEAIEPLKDAITKIDAGIEVLKDRKR